jgi:hypothetical protein
VHRNILNDCKRQNLKKKKTIIDNLFSMFAIKGVFDSVVVVVFQIAFRAEIHANDVFLFFKNYF